MAEIEESPAQRQARIRREKREAKIKGTAQERLEKITKLSGRTPETSEDNLDTVVYPADRYRVVNTGSPMTTPPRTASPAIAPPAVASPMPNMTNSNEQEQMRLQEEYLRTLLRSQTPQQPAEGPESEDPMMKMISSMMSGMGGMGGLPGMGGMGGIPGMGGPGDDPNATGMPSLNPDDIAKAIGIPPFLVNMVLGKQEAPVTPAQQKEARNWTLLHILFAMVAGIYMLFTLGKLTSAFGESPPAPATIQNPFVIFVMGEMMLYGAQTVLSNSPRKSGLWFWIQTAKDIGRDASMMVFMLGVHSWWQGIS